MLTWAPSPRPSPPKNPGGEGERQPISARSLAARSLTSWRSLARLPVVLAGVFTHPLHRRLPHGGSGRFDGPRRMPRRPPPPALPRCAGEGAVSRHLQHRRGSGIGLGRFDRSRHMPRRPPSPRSPPAARWEGAFSTTSRTSSRARSRAEPASPGTGEDRPPQRSGGGAGRPKRTTIIPLPGPPLAHPAHRPVRVDSARGKGLRRGRVTWRRWRSRNGSGWAAR